MNNVLPISSAGVPKRQPSTKGEDDTTLGGSGGNGGGMDHKEYTNIKVGELAAQVQAANDRLLTKLEGLSSKLDNHAERLPSRTWLILNSLAVIGTILAVLALWAGGYMGGFGASAAYSDALATQERKIDDAERAADARAARIEAAVDGLIKRMEEQ
jgi:hypothetical protein